MELDDEQLAVLARLVAAERSVPRGDRHPFLHRETMRGSGYDLIHDGVPPDAPLLSHADLETLAAAGYVAFTSTGGYPAFFVTNAGFAFHDRHMRRRADPEHRAQAIVGDYLATAQFRTRYPRAHGKWTRAETMLWGDDTAQTTTTIGHVLRETMQEFAAELLQRHPAARAEADHTKTVSRIRSVLDTVPITSDSERAFLAALLAYWGTASDLVQRQEHGAQREREALTWFDSRRVVLQVAVVMFEIDATLDRRRR